MGDQERIVALGDRYVVKVQAESIQILHERLQAMETPLRIIVSLPRAAGYAALVLVLACLHTPAKATSIRGDEVNKIGDLAKRAAKLAEDIGETGQSVSLGFASNARSYTTAQIDKTATMLTCLSALQGTAGHVSNFLYATTLTLGTSSLMKDKNDEALSLRFTRIPLSDQIAYLPAARKTVNDMAADCYDSALINAKAHAILDLIDETETVIVPIARRIGVQVR